MRIDLYTKGVLTVIAVLLAVIAFRPYVSPDAVVQAQGPFAGVQYSSVEGFPTLFDSRTGEVWGYFNGRVDHTRIAKLGAPWVKEK